MSFQPRQRPLAIDLFSGCGGLTQGLFDAGFSVLAAVELEAKARATYQLNHPSVWLAGEDIRLVEPSELLRKLCLHPGDLDLVAGCPPCQGFSRMRQRNRGRAPYDSRNGLIHDFFRFVNTIKPKLVMMENVPGLSKYSAYKIFRRGLASIGYHVRDAILNVADYGVPQNRKRLILVASLHVAPSFAPPIGRVMTVRDAIAKLPASGQSGDLLHDLPQRRSDRITALIEAVPKDGGSRSSLPLSKQLACHRRTDGFSDVYGRMCWDAPSPTITGGCYNPSKGRFLHPQADRAISLREASLLQGFPQDYCFDVSHGREAISLMIGNALPPPFIAAHARMLAAQGL